MSSLPFHAAPVDVLRYGFQSLETDANIGHPMKKIEKNVCVQYFFSIANPDHLTHLLQDGWDDKLLTARRMYGIHMAMRLATEKESFEKPNRLYGLPSSRYSVLLLDSLL